MVGEDAVEDEGVVLVGEFAETAAKGEVVLFLGNKGVVNKFTEGAVEVGVVLSGKDVVVDTFTGMVSTETEGSVVDMTLTDTVAEDKAVTVGVALLEKDVMGKFRGMVVEMVSKGQSLCLFVEDPDKF